MCRGHSSQRAVRCLQNEAWFALGSSLRPPDRSWEVRALPAPRDWSTQSLSSHPAPECGVVLGCSRRPSCGCLPFPRTPCLGGWPLGVSRNTWVLWTSFHGVTHGTGLRVHAPSRCASREPRCLHTRNVVFRNRRVCACACVYVCMCVCMRV